MVLDKDSAYYNGVCFAHGIWRTASEWTGKYQDGRNVSFIQASEDGPWRHYENDHFVHEYVHYCKIPTYAVILQKTLFHPQVVTDTYCLFGSDKGSGEWETCIEKRTKPSSCRAEHPDQTIKNKARRHV